MRPRTKSSLLWGVVGVLTVATLTLGYDLVVGPFPLGFPGRVALAAVVGAVVAGVSYAVEHRAARWGR